MKENEKKGEHDVLEQGTAKEKNSPGGREADQAQERLAFQVIVGVHIYKNSGAWCWWFNGI